MCTEPMWGASQHTPEQLRRISVLASASVNRHAEQQGCDLLARRQQHMLVEAIPVLRFSTRVRCTPVVSWCATVVEGVGDRDRLS